MEHRLRRRALALAVLVAGVVPAGGLAQEIREVHDVIYGRTDGMAMVYDLRAPATGANGAGVVFVVSGGFLSTRESQAMIAPVAEPLVEAGFTVFYLRHPSTPRYLAPEIYEATRAGLDHILANAPRFGVDPGRIGVLGMSTGGLLALLLGLDVAVEEAPRPAAVVAYMPIADMRTEVGNVRATPSLGFAPELAPSLSPVDFVSADDPPMLFIHGDRDEVVPLEPNSRRMLDMVRGAGVASELVVVEGGHELFTGEAKATADAAVVRWFSEHLGGEGR